MSTTAGTVIGIAEATTGIGGIDVSDCGLDLDLKTLAGPRARQRAAPKNA
ncbi:MAG TPA: hypothetical protein VGD63_14015 [Steroidobacteraceae bacterium]